MLLGAKIGSLSVIENEFTPGHLPEPPSPHRRDQQQIEAEILSRGIEAIELADAPRSIVEYVKCNHCGRAALVIYTDGVVEGCGCRPKAPGGLKRVPPSSAQGFSSLRRLNAANRATMPDIRQSSALSPARLKLCPYLPGS